MQRKILTHLHVLSMGADHALVCQSRERGRGHAKGAVEDLKGTTQQALAVGYSHLHDQLSVLWDAGRP